MPKLRNIRGKVVMKPTFKKLPRLTGLASIGAADFIDIKVKKKVIGQIISPSRFGADYWRIGFQIIKRDIMEDGNPNCAWRWLFVWNNATDEASARQWVIDNFDRISAAYAFKEPDDD
jgi:hypothetical protein